MIYIGENQISGIYLGDAEIFGIYAGDLQLYPMGEFQGLKLTPKSLSFASTGETKTIKVKSSAAWEIQPFTGDWLSFSQMSGEAGIFEIQATALPIEDEDRSLEIVFNTVDMEYSAVLPVEQKNVVLLTDIYASTGETPQNAAIYTNIYPSVNLKFRVSGTISANNNYDILAGIFAPSDSNDFRLFLPYTASGWYFDVGSRRRYASVAYPAGSKFDVTAGKYFVYNNLTNTFDLANSTDSYVPPTTIAPMCVSLYRAKINTFQIWEGDGLQPASGELLFDGHAAIINGVVGLYDTVSGQMFTTDKTTLYYDE